MVVAREGLSKNRILRHLLTIEAHSRILRCKWWRLVHEAPRICAGLCDWVCGYGSSSSLLRKKTLAFWVQVLSKPLMDFHFHIACKRHHYGNIFFMRFSTGKLPR